MTHLKRILSLSVQFVVNLDMVQLPVDQLMMAVYGELGVFEGIYIFRIN